MIRKTQGELTTVWQQYQKGIQYLAKKNIFEQTDENFRMFEGDQWYGLQSDGERLPILNIIAPIVKYKVAMVAQNGMSIHYSSMNYQDMLVHKLLSEVCENLNQYASKLWERMKLDKMSWEVIQDACIAGSSYVYFYQDGQQMRAEKINNTNILFGNEQDPNIQAQPYILISQRLFVDDVKRQAQQNGLSKSEIAMILPDTDTEYEAGDSAKDEVDGAQKCTCVMKLWKQDGVLHICRSTRNVMYQKDTKIDGMTLYPVASLIWEPKKGSARSDGVVRWLIPNQLEINKAQARLSIAVKKSAYPTMAVKIDAIENPDMLETVGATIEVNSESVQDIDNIVKYIQPAQINSLAKSMTDDLISITRDLAGASDAVTGQVNPENASGAAIIAVRDAAALPMNATVAAYKQFVEDIALIWYDLWTAYHPDGMQIVVDDSPVFIEGQALRMMQVDVRVDVSATNPYSKFAQEQALENLMAGQYITFEEYVQALDDDAAAPKGKLSDIIDKRRAQQQAQMQMQMQQQLAENQMQQPQQPQPNDALIRFNQELGRNIQ